MNDDYNEYDKPLILVVDDEFLQRLPMCEALSQGGFRVLEAEDGVDAWALIREESPDLVISDVIMPRMDGFELCQMIRGAEKLQHLPIVLATSLDDLSSIEHAYRLGATDFITKPINWSLLGHRIRSDFLIPRSFQLALFRRILHQFVNQFISRLRVAELDLVQF
ncbi:MAG: response regulator [Magnetococcales bacterium]|nr:response regulator [Magnetococcales bacterium]